MPRVKSILFEKSARLTKVLSRSAAALVSVSRAKNDRQRTGEISRNWAIEVLKTCGITDIKVTGHAICKEPCLFLGNHMSYLDIPLLYTQASVVFVAKKEVQDWPLFGRCATAAGTIYIDRKSMHSRRDVARSIVSGILEDKKSIVVFPEGTSSVHGKPWKRGAIAVAKDHDIPVQAFRVAYRPARDAAFIDDDDLTSHLWNLFGIEKIEASLEFFEPMKITDPIENTRQMQNWVQDSLAKELQDDVSY